VPVDLAIARRAAPQHGMVTRAQLFEAGLSVQAIAYRLKVGRFIRMHPGVYAVGHRPPSPLARAMAAVLACGQGAMLGYRSAATLWVIQSRWRGPIEVIAPGNHLLDGVRVHRSRSLTPRDVTVHFGIPVTTPARTLLDLAETLSDKALARAVNEAQVKRLLKLDDLAALLMRSPGRHGRTRLQRFVDYRQGPTRSGFEDAFLAFAECYGLPRPEVNQVVAGYEVDVLWRDQRLIVELDSREYHDHAQPFEYDRDKDAHLLAAGFPVVRVTWRRLVDMPGREAARLKALLATAA
jgi:putative AbiEi antitoxin of type IV toxin-antitoxin system/uncharacterized protein DUF559